MSDAPCAVKHPGGAFFDRLTLNAPSHTKLFVASFVVSFVGNLGARQRSGDEEWKREWEEENRELGEWSEWNWSDREVRDESAEMSG